MDPHFTADAGTTSSDADIDLFVSSSDSGVSRWWKWNIVKPRLKLSQEIHFLWWCARSEGWQKPNTSSFICCDFRACAPDLNCVDWFFLIIYFTFDNEQTKKSRFWIQWAQFLPLQPDIKVRTKGRWQHLCKFICTGGAFLSRICCSHLAFLQC